MQCGYSYLIWAFAKQRLPHITVYMISDQKSVTYGKTFERNTSGQDGSFKLTVIFTLPYLA